MPLTAITRCTFRKSINRMYTTRPPFFYRMFSPGRLLCEMPGNEKAIYLTFDDGPVPEATPEVLDILKSFNVKATFFMVGENVRKNPDIFHRIMEEGHAAGNHTYNHLNGWQTSTGSYAENVYRCHELFQSKLFRPPHGRFTVPQYFLLRKQFRFVLWSVLPGDFHAGTTAEKCLKKAIDYSGPGSIVVFHDSIKAREKVLKVLPQYLEHFLGKGFGFRTL
jgi:peptidoglycan-N-acetylglucosamine deacetylase